ncbi:MAG TPA: Crp/Fnr family transcriptional regulator [Chitinispirillaceae bacterium]|nr:Crp/Fnr family transcriptional regulator [Chitinispirillaceae bacterium]
MNDPKTVDLEKRIVRYPRGSFLFRQNDTSQDLFIIQSGSIRIFKTEGNVEIDLDVVGNGMVVGEIASIDGGPRTASGYALEDTEVIVIPSSEFQRILAAVPDYFRKIALILVQRLRMVDEKINRSIEGDRTSHVAAIISLLSYSEHCLLGNRGFEINLKFLENEIMDLLNIPPSEIAEILEKLDKQGVIKIEKTKCVLNSKSHVDTIAEHLFSTAGDSLVI